jgi:parallel beta-helix repeat protein
MDHWKKCRFDCLLVLAAVVAFASSSPLWAGDGGRATGPVAGRTFYIDPARGHIDNEGTRAAPWRTLQEVIEHNLIETRTYADLPYRQGAALTVKNPGAPVKAGDTLVLRDGDHGQFRLRGACNADTITVRAAPGHEPLFSRVFLSAVSKWHLEGLTVRPVGGGGQKAYPLIQVESHGWHGPSSDVTIVDCNVYSVWDSGAWTREDWNTLACNGIQVSGNRMVLQENRLKNINFGLSLSGNNGRVSHNRVENFAGDGLRGLGNDLVFEYNTVKNCYNVNDNHDDGFQSWSIKDDPPRERIVLRGNTIINYEDPNQPFRGPLQGIGCFDGPYIDWIVENNLVIVDHYHGISFYGAKNCRIVNNTVVDCNSGKPGPPWIAVHPHKDKTPSSNCLIRNNIASKVVATAGVTADHNLLLPGLGERIFMDPDHRDYHLRAEAPAIDAAGAEWAPELDLDGRPRPQGGGYDIGAYEYPER